ncbi:uncharacterized protein LOC119661491 [Hermetia illucens]|uniref:uncharacterized protein LOC119661491 n=1 Tax=Hermetia illucens TaxID=343691 RepID=UPI0018CC2993|nr:uncharacterized protein LOC119661491 [Hermetia illucens]
MDEPIISQIKFLLLAVSFALWASFYNTVRHNFPERSPMSCNHYVAVFFSVLSVIFLYLAPELQMWSCDDGTILNGWWEIFSTVALIIIWGYLAYSLVWTMYYGEEIVVYSYFMISLLLINHYLFLKSCGREVIIKGVCFFELSKPSAQAKWHLRKLGEDKWLGHKLIGIFTYSFLVLIRIIFGSLYMSAIVFSNFYDIMDKLVAAYFYIFGIVAFHNIVPLCRELLDSEEVLVQLKPIESKLKKL